MNRMSVFEQRLFALKAVLATDTWVDTVSKKSA